MAAPSTGGYECEFVDSISKDFECPLCLSVTREPHLTSCCGQHFCQSCISPVLSDQKPCPLCMTYPFRVFYNKKQRRRVTELKVYCTEKNRGCSWIGELRELNSHLDTSCQYVDVPCTNNCGETLQRQLLHKHLSEICPKRDFPCRYCGYKATYEDVHGNHMPVCTKYPLPCPNNCGNETVERGSLEKHLSECPLQVVSCEFSQLGCREKIQRKDLSKHMEENARKHLVVMSATLGGIIGMNTQLEVKLQQNERKLAEQDKQIEQLQTKILFFEQTYPLLPPVDLTIQNFSQNKGQRLRWNQCPPFYTHIMGAKIKIGLFCSSSRYGGIDIELDQMPGEFDSAINWPLRCTVTVHILNQERDSDHLKCSREFALTRQTKQYAVPRDIGHISYSTLRPTQYDIVYIKDDNLHMRADVTLK